MLELPIVSGTPSALLCPSAQPEMEDPRLIGVSLAAKGQPARVAYLEAPLPFHEVPLDALHGAPAGSVLRIAARCEVSRCAHFNGRHCELVRRVVDRMEAVVDVLPDCGIRPECRWFAEEGRAACLRCPQVVTAPLTADASLREVAYGTRATEDDASGPFSH
jgi:hypothetical protein